MNGVVAVADEITLIRLYRPQAVGMTGMAFAVLIGLALLPGVGHADPHTGVWFMRTSSRWEVQAPQGLLPFRGGFLRGFMGAVRT